MNLTKYDGTIHPEEWVKQIRLEFCNKIEIAEQYKLDFITNCENQVVKYCRLLIHSSIIIPYETRSFTELINALKSDISYDAFKSSVKRKLQALKLDNACKNETENLKFLNNFKQLCYEGEITKIEEQKKLFLNVFPKNSIQYHFINCNFDKINSMKELFEYFHESIAEECKTIKNGSSITLKHVATGRYLSSHGIYRYQTGSNKQAVFAGEKLLYTNAVWLLKLASQQIIYQSDKMFYGDTICLAHKASANEILSKDKLFISNDYKSPTTGHREVSCVNSLGSGFNCINANPTNNNTPYVRTKDIITLKSGDDILRSHDFTFAIEDKTFQEVVGHQERIGGNDEWQIEFIEDI